MTRSLLLLAIALVACGPTSRNGDDTTHGDGGGDDGGGCVANRCSADMHDVIDCAGNVVQTCADGTGCGNGACIDPCQAASANSRATSRARMSRPLMR